MAFTGSFTKTNDGATALDAFIIADTSSYADEAKSTFTGRRIYLYDYQGNKIYPASQDIFTPGVDATATFETQSVPAEGMIVGFRINDPDDGFIFMPTYTVQAGDFGNITTFNTNWKVALNTNTYGYFFDVATTIVTVTARPNLGTAINGYSILPSDVNGNITNFIGGTDGTTEVVTNLDYIDFSFDLYTDDEISINLLTADAALRIDVQWISADPQQGSAYTDSGAFDFLDYANQFKYALIQQLAINKSLKSNRNFFETLSILQANIDASSTSISNDDQYESQMCIINTQYIMANLNLFY